MKLLDVPAAEAPAYALLRGASFTFHVRSLSVSIGKGTKRGIDVHLGQCSSMSVAAWFCSVLQPVSSGTRYRSFLHIVHALFSSCSCFSFALPRCVACFRFHPALVSFQVLTLWTEHANTLS
jgi:hypothetical protein